MITIFLAGMRWVAKRGYFDQPRIPFPDQRTWVRDFCPWRKMGVPRRRPK